MTELPVPHITPRRIMKREDYMNTYAKDLDNMFAYIKQSMHSYPYSVNEQQLYMDLAKYVYHHSMNASKAYHFFK